MRLSPLLALALVACPAPEDTTELPPAELVDLCEVAAAGPALAPGHYAGDSTSWGNELSSECLGVPTEGEAFGAVEVPDGALLILDALMEQGDAMLFLFDDCGAVDTCRAAQDIMLGGEAEHLVWLNDTGAARSLVLALDTAEQTLAGPWTLDVQVVETLVEATPADDCAAAQGADFLEAGWYHADLRAMTALFDPREGNDCTGFSALSPEGLFPVRIPAGGTLTVRGASSPQADVSIYLLQDCADLQTCVAGADDGEPETFSYTNDTGAELVSYVVVDGWGYEGNPEDVFFEVVFE